MEKPTFLVPTDEQGSVLVPDWLQVVLGLYDGPYLVRVEKDRVVLIRLEPDQPAATP